MVRKTSKILHLETIYSDLIQNYIAGQASTYVLAFSASLANFLLRLLRIAARHLFRASGNILDRSVFSSYFTFFPL